MHDEKKRTGCRWFEAVASPSVALLMVLYLTLLSDSLSF